MPTSEIVVHLKQYPKDPICGQALDMGQATADGLPITLYKCRKCGMEFDSSDYELYGVVEIETLG